METNSGNKAKLFAKMARVMGELQSFTKDKTNAHFKYDYASAEQVFFVIGRKMAEHGIAHFIEILEIVQVDKLTRVHYLITLADSETGESVSLKWQGDGSGYDDKTIAKATTTALKYFLLSTFVISSGESEEGHEDVATEKQGKSASKPSAPANAPKDEKPKGAPTSDELGKDNAEWLNGWAFKNFKMSFDDVKKALGLNKHIQYFKGTLPKAIALILLYASEGDFDSAAKLAQEKLGEKSATVIEVLEDMASA